MVYFYIIISIIFKTRIYIITLHFILQLLKRKYMKKIKHCTIIIIKKNEPLFIVFIIMNNNIMLKE